MRVQQNDPSELLEVFDASGRPTGRAMSRAAIHLDGRWHQAFHCWIVRAQGLEVVLQRRAMIGDGIVDRHRGVFGVQYRPIPDMIALPQGSKPPR